MQDWLGLTPEIPEATLLCQQICNQSRDMMHG